MKVTAEALSPILPLSSSLAAAIAFTAIYGVLSPIGYGYFGIWKVRAASAVEQPPAAEPVGCNCVPNMLSSLGSPPQYSPYLSSALGAGGALQRGCCWLCW